MYPVESCMATRSIVQGNVSWTVHLFAGRDSSVAEFSGYHQGGVNSLRGRKTSVDLGDEKMEVLKLVVDGVRHKESISRARDMGHGVCLSLVPLSGCTRCAWHALQVFG